MQTRLNPYASTAEALIAVGRDITNCMDTSQRGAAIWSRIAARDLAMASPLDSEEHRFAEICFEGAKIIHDWVLDAPDGTDVTEMILNRDWLLGLAEHFCPPKPDYGGANVVPFIPRVRG